MKTSIITGDIIKSRHQTDTELWLSTLKEALSYLNTNPQYWDIYRGDSFQIELKDVFSGFIAAVYIKACIKTIHGLDVRLAIGIGDKSYKGDSVSESTGAAFIYSGETLETLKKDKQNLRIKTNNSQIDKELNLYFSLALIAMDRWTVNSAEIVKLTIEKPNALQSELGEIIGINQNAISTRQKRAYLDQILELDSLYQEKIATLV
ncbi:transcriptional regulator [Winogradskyella sp. F6397]|uniref:Transcriptional regulator n=1 Tax=Winogradskyella marina TaxID=2785530 RepID=A0ABS0EIC4_9FLAO|nr:transcriptional regulator [Winogradskyella marina]MBF8149322.1 transcriptional regulator [Winogradskyella marina]